MHDDFFRRLTPTEEIEFRQWARDNFNPSVEPSEVWHPIVRDEWAKIKAERTNT